MSFQTTFQSLSEIYQCMLRNAAIQAITSELKHFAFLTNIVKCFEEYSYFSSNSNQAIKAKTLLQNYLLENWQDSQNHESKKVDKRNGRLKALFESLSNPTDTRIGDLITYTELKIRQELGLTQTSLCSKQHLSTFLELITMDPEAAGKAKDSSAGRAQRKSKKRGGGDKSRTSRNTSNKGSRLMYSGLRRTGVGRSRSHKKHKFENSIKEKVDTSGPQRGHPKSSKQPEDDSFYRTGAFSRLDSKSSGKINFTGAKLSVNSFAHPEQRIGSSEANRKGMLDRRNMSQQFQHGRDGNRQAESVSGHSSGLKAISKIDQLTVESYAERENKRRLKEHLDRYTDFGAQLNKSNLGSNYIQYPGSGAGANSSLNSSTGGGTNPTATTGGTVLRLPQHQKDLLDKIAAMNKNMTNAGSLGPETKKKKRRRQQGSGTRGTSPISTKQKSSYLGSIPEGSGAGGGRNRFKSKTFYKKNEKVKIDFNTLIEEEIDEFDDREGGGGKKNINVLPKNLKVFSRQTFGPGTKSGSFANLGPKKGRNGGKKGNGGAQGSVKDRIVNTNIAKTKKRGSLKTVPGKGYGSSAAKKKSNFSERRIAEDGMSAQNLSGSLKTTFVQEINFSFDNINRDFIEEGCCKQIHHIGEEDYLFIFDDGSVMKYNLKKTNLIMEPIKISKKAILSSVVDLHKDVWIATYKGLLIFDRDMKFLDQINANQKNEKKLPFDEFDPYDDDDISIAATSSNNNIKRTKVGSLSLSHNQQYIYYLFSPTKVAMINILERRVMKVFGSEVIGQNITEIRMLTKKFMLTLNANRDYFKLCNIKECRKEGGVKLRDHESSQKSVKCVTFDVSKKGSKLVVAGQNEQKVCFLYVFKVTQTGFIQKFFNYNVAKISKVRLVERVYEPMNATFLLITSEHALHIFSVDNYQLRYLKSVKNVSKGGNTCIEFSNKIAVLGADDQSVNFYRVLKTELGESHNNLSPGLTIQGSLGEARMVTTETDFSGFTLRKGPGGIGGLRDGGGPGNAMGYISRDAMLGIGSKGKKRVKF